MRYRLLAGTISVAFGAGSAGAQTAQCAGAPVAAQDACFAAIDLFHYMAPQLGISTTGGNVVLSQGGANAGLARISFGVRANVLTGSVPVLQAPSATGPALRTATSPYPTEDQYFGLPAAEASIGVFRGFRLGFTSVGGIDAIVSAAFVPTATLTSLGSTISIEPETQFKIGYGARVGLIEESTFVPGLAVNYMVRDLPTTTMLASVGSDSMIVNDLSIKTTSWRVTAAKSFAAFTLAAGLGQDTYDASTGIESLVNRPVIGRVTTGPLTAAQKTTRSNVFADFALNLMFAKLVAEAGIVSGGDISTANVFDIGAGVSRIYGSAGLRIGF